MATAQKCLRTGDLDIVGTTPFHHTFFEMMGNFSFGDYFKEESIVWAWEFMRDEMGIPEQNMVVSIYEEDEEAFGIWRKVIGLPAEKICRYGEGDNYWPANVRAEGPNGPCGPCSEIFHDKGPGVGCGRSDCQPSCNCDRFVEVWNLVFQQFDRRADGTLAPLPTRNIDTGMGLERMARIMQGVKTNYDIDAFRPLMARIATVCGQPYDTGAPTAPLMRRIADHSRAVFFCIADGVIPSNEERGYVVRRLLRRAVRDAVQLGVEEPFLTDLIDPVLESFGKAYPELVKSREHTATIVGQEERSFQRTVKRGSVLLTEQIAALKRQKASVLRGRDVFDLYQTYGFPLEMTESLLHEHGMTVDMQGFLCEMEAHRNAARNSAAFEKSVFAAGPVSQLQAGCEPTEFTGYQTLESEAQIIGIIAGDELVESAEPGREVSVVLDRTPAYGESGGQTGDAGIVRVIGNGQGEFAFRSTRREKGFFLHDGEVRSGVLRAGAQVVCTADKAQRAATARNHTATHLLHYALRTVLGQHATQSGSAVSAERLRFDFSNPSEMSDEQIRRVEDIVNEKVLADEPVSATHMSRSEAQELGAVALFGEKYGDIVRVIGIGDYSRELCGGTHCQRTGEIGLFRILSESSVAGGVRRIEAVTGLNSLARLRQKEGMLAQLCQSLGTQEDNLTKRTRELQGEIRSLQKDLQKAREQAVRQMASGGGLIGQAEEIAGARVICTKLEGGHAELRSAADVLRTGNENVACLLAAEQGGKVALVAALSKDLVQRGLNAVEIVKAASAVLGGGGGGRADLAQAGGEHASKLNEAFEAARQHIRQKLGGR
jgi:alanyl-tRNA synthetase